MPRATRNRTLIAQARVSEAELAEWRAKAAAAGVPLSELLRRGDGADAHLDRSRRQSRAGAHAGAGADRVEPEPDRPLGEHPQGERRGAGSGRASGRHRAGARHFDRRGGTAMMIKFLARGTGSAAAAADYLSREQNLAPEQDQDQDQDRDPGEEPGRSQSAARQSAPGGRRGRRASVRAQVHVGRHRLGTGGQTERCANRPSGGRVRENRLGGPRTGPLRLGSGPAPRSGRGGPRACPGGALRS